MAADLDEEIQWRAQRRNQSISIHYRKEFLSGIHQVIVRPSILGFSLASAPTIVIIFLIREEETIKSCCVAFFPGATLSTEKEYFFFLHLSFAFFFLDSHLFYL
jgi:hypothetical protein